MPGLKDWQWTQDFVAVVCLRCGGTGRRWLLSCRCCGGGGWKLNQRVRIRRPAHYQDSAAKENPA